MANTPMAGFLRKESFSPDVGRNSGEMVVLLRSIDFEGKFGLLKMCH